LPAGATLFAGLALVVSGCAPDPGGALPRPEFETQAAFDGRTEVSIPWSARAGERYVAVLAQRDADADLAVADPDGRPLVHVASPARALGREIAFFEPRASGPVTIEVRTPTRPADGAAYSLSIHRLPPDVPAATRDAFERLTRAAAVGGGPEAERAKAMLDDDRAAEAAFRRRDPRLAAEAALRAAAVSYWIQDDWLAAIDATERARAALRDVADPVALADVDVLSGLARIELSRDRRGTDEADARRLLAGGEAEFGRARAAYAAAGRPVAAALARVYEGTARYYAYDLAGAVERYTDADAALGRLHAVGERTLVLGNLAVTSADRGDYAGAARVYDSLLPLLVGRDDETYALNLASSAGALLFLGETERALDRYVDALEVARRSGAERAVTLALVGLGVTHLYLGQPDVAATHLQSALDRLPAGERHSRVLALLRLGDARRAQRDLRRADAAHAEAARLAEGIGAPALRARAAATRADDQLTAGRYAAAVRTYTEALSYAVPEGHALVARALVGRGRAHRLAGDLDAARADLERAAALAAAGGNREERIAATYEQAELAAQSGDRERALDLATRTTDGIRELLGGVANPDNRITLATRLRAARDLRVALLADAALARRVAGDPAGANARALDALFAADDGASGTRTAAPDATATERRRLAEDLAARRYRLEALAERATTPTPTMLAIEREIAVLRSRLTRAGDGTTAARAPAPAGRPDLATLRSRVPVGSALIVYSLGADRSWRWTITRERFDLDPLPPAREIDRGVTQLLDAVRAMHAPERAAVAARALAARVVPAGLAPGTRRLVVPDGSLGAVPWALLGDDDSAPTLQLSSLAPLVAPGAPAAAWSPPRPLRLALFGDPVFGSDDARATPTAGAGPPLGRPLPRLPGTEREVRAIAALAAPGSALVETGYDATRAALLALPRGRVDVLHLATHATLDAEVPALASLVLSRRDAAGRPLQADLRADEIARLRAAAPLVVLSACDTAAEPSRSAAGLMNLTRAFLGGGTRYVVASRWAVGDASAVALMTEFYRGLLTDGLAPDVALARAQRTLATSPAWRAPFHWAGFVVTGSAP
jgi:tetratricopeptide (TPR) repeat protein